ncbi:MAG: ABC transporter permease [Campylobacterales bacterium]|nr:ABC transporter permease [Campylobacterales bacterium]
MLYSLALKNILASKGRSITTFLLSLFTTVLFIVYVAFMDGSHVQIIQNSVEIYTGYGHINVKGYEEAKDYDHLIEDAASIETLLGKESSLAYFSPRFETYALLSNKEISIGSMIGGIIPSKEKNLSRLQSALIKGTYLDDNDTNAVYLGSDLAKRLKADLGDKIALIGSSLDNATAADLFTVKGIFKTGLFEFDSNSAFVNKTYLDTLMMSQNKASYFILRFHHDKDTFKEIASLNQKLPREYEALSWKDLLSALVQAMEVDSLFGYLSISIFFLVIFFVIMIFGYVNIYTRTKQIGLLRALGFTPGAIKKLLFGEHLILIASSVLIGALIGSAVSYYFHIHPILIPGLADMYKDYGVVIDSIATDFNPLTIGWDTLAILLLNSLSIGYPIRQINKLSVTETMRYV